MPCPDGGARCKSGHCIERRGVGPCNARRCVLMARFSTARGGVYFALITQALRWRSPHAHQQTTVYGGFNGLTDFHTLLGFELGADRLSGRSIGRRSSCLRSRTWGSRADAVAIWNTCCERRAMGRTGCVTWVMTRRPTG